MHAINTPAPKCNSAQDVQQTCLHAFDTNTKLPPRAQSSKAQPARRIGKIVHPLQAILADVRSMRRPAEPESLHCPTPAKPSARPRADYRQRSHSRSAYSRLWAASQNQRNKRRCNDIGLNQPHPPLIERKMRCFFKMPYHNRSGQIHTQRGGKCPTFAPSPNGHACPGRDGDCNCRGRPKTFIIDVGMEKGRFQSQNNGSNACYSHPNRRQADQGLRRPFSIR